MKPSELINEQTMEVAPKKSKLGKAALIGGGLLGAGALVSNIMRGEDTPKAPPIAPKIPEGYTLSPKKEGYNIPKWAVHTPAAVAAGYGIKKYLDNKNKSQGKPQSKIQQNTQQSTQPNRPFNKKQR